MVEEHPTLFLAKVLGKFETIDAAAVTDGAVDLADYDIELAGVGKVRVIFSFSIMSVMPLNMLVNHSVSEMRGIMSDFVSVEENGTITKNLREVADVFSINRPIKIDPTRINMAKMALMGGFA